MSFRLLAVGEILWDLLPSGKQLGGAPANFAYHAHALGAEARVASRVGNDPLGREILDRLRALGLPIDSVGVDATAPTGTVSVELAADGQPHFTIHENVAWDRITADDASRAFAAQADAACFGSLAQRSEPSRSSIRKLVAATPAKALRIFDINLRQHFYSRDIVEDSLRLVNVLKLNDAELPVVARLLDLAGDERSWLEQLVARYNLKAIALTKGAQGSVLFVANTLVSRPAAKVKVVDTVGAGDAYTAAMALGLLAGLPPERIIENAHRLAEFVCTQPGATPPLPGELRRMVQR
ncbi:MAG: carbohydrate kinase [Verrucomicrobia bacterium]|nr:carbohydrate kinase [Verrucomicrobiota bacterium]